MDTISQEKEEILLLRNFLLQILINCQVGFIEPTIYKSTHSYCKTGR